jgi:hypothetical protein
MTAGSAVRNRSLIVTNQPARGQVEVLRQQMPGLRGGGSWTWFWLARRKGSGNWSEAAREAIRRATLLPHRTLPAWLGEAAVEAERQIISAAGTPP